MIAIALGKTEHKAALVSPPADGSDSMHITFGNIVITMDRETAADMADKILRLEKIMLDAEFDATKGIKNDGE